MTNFWRLEKLKAKIQIVLPSNLIVYTNMSQYEAVKYESQSAERHHKPWV